MLSCCRSGKCGGERGFQAETIENAGLCPAWFSAAAAAARTSLSECVKEREECPIGVESEI